MCLPQAELAAMFKPQKVMAQPSTSSSTVVSGNVVADVEEKPKLFVHDDDVDKKPIIIESTSPPLLPPSAFDDKINELVDESDIPKPEAVEEFDSVLVKTEPEELEVIDVTVRLFINLSLYMNVI